MAKRKPKKLKEIVEYRHFAPVQVPPWDIQPGAMHDVVKRLELWVTRADCAATEDQKRDIWRLIASREDLSRRVDRVGGDLARAHAQVVRHDLRDRTVRHINPCFPFASFVLKGPTLAEIRAMPNAAIDALSPTEGGAE